MSIVDTFALVINYLNEFRILMNCAIVFVKNEGTNLIFMATTLCSIIDCHPLKLQHVYEGTCFGHVMSKT